MNIFKRRSYQEKARRWIIYFITFQLIIPNPGVFASGIAVDPNQENTYTDVSQNNIDVVNINTPTAKGVSGNKFSQYNVQESGVIINNSTKNDVSELGGALYANPNMVHGSSAGIVVFEVTGQDQSKLLGVTEMFGDQAEFILSNPNGIYVNGVGFINVNKVTLTTGQTHWKGGEVSRFHVQRGVIDIGPSGFNASNLDYVDIIARAVKVGGEIRAKDALRVLAGNNEVDFQDKTVTKIQGDGTPAPILGIDSSHLGGMYANRIHLISTEEGVGVNTQGTLIARQGDLKVDSAGDVLYEESLASNKVEVKASGNITQEGLSYSGDATSLESEGTVTLDGDTYSEGAVNVSAKKDIQTTEYLDGFHQVVAQNTVLDASGNIQLQDIEVESQTVVIKSGLDTGVAVSGLYAENVSLNVGGSLTVDHQTEILGQTGIDVDVQNTLSNRGYIESNAVIVSADSVENEGDVVSFDKTQINARETLTNSGVVWSEGQVSLNAKQVVNIGQVESYLGSTSVEAEIIENNGLLEGEKSVDIKAEKSVENKGVIYSNQEIRIASGGDVVQRGEIQATQVTVTANQVIQSDGGLIVADGLTLESETEDIQILDSDMYVGGEATVKAKKSLTVASSNLNVDGDLNASSQEGTVLLTGSGTTVYGEANFSGETVHLGAGNELLVGSRLGVESSTFKNDASSYVLGVGEFTVKSSSVTNKGLIDGGSEFTVIDSDTLNNEGVIQASDKVSLSGNTLTNSGDIYAEEVAMESTSMNNEKGAIVGYDKVELKATQVLNQSTDSNLGEGIYAGNQISILTSGLNNTGGSIQSYGDLTFNTGVNRLANTGGSIKANGAVSLNYNGNFVVNGLYFANDLNVVANQIDNRNTNGETVGLVGGDYLRLSATNGGINNTSGVLKTAGIFQIKATGDIINTNGKIVSQYGVVDANNYTSTVESSSGTVQNTGGEIAGGYDTEISAVQMTNNGGQVFGTGNVEIHTSTSMDNTNGEISSNLDVEISKLNNQTGKIFAGRDLSVTSNAVDMGQMLGSFRVGRDIYYGVTTEGLGLNPNTVNSYAITGDLYAEKGLYINTETNLGLENQAKIQAGEFLSIRTNHLNNKDTIASNGGLYIDVKQNVTNAGDISSLSSMQIKSSGLTNEKAGEIRGGNGTQLSVTNDLNNYGKVVSSGILDIAAKNLYNVAGDIQAGGDLYIDVSENLINRREWVVTHDSVTNPSYWTKLPSGHTSYWTSTTEHRTDASEKAATIYSDGNMNIESEYLKNEASSIIAKQNMTMNIGTLDNLSYIDGDVHKQDWYWRHKHWHKGWGNCSHWGHTHTKTIYELRQDVSATIKAGGTLYGNIRDSLNNETIGDQQLIDGLNQQDMAGLTVDPEVIGQSGLDSTAYINNVETHSVKTKTRGGLFSQTLDQTKSSVGGTSKSRTTYTIGDTASLTKVNQQIDEGGIQTVSYLKETDPNLTDMENFPGLAYMMQRIGFNPEDELKTIGDPFYEQRLISETIQQATGKPFLSKHIHTEEEQMAALIDGAIEANEYLDLNMGVSLSPEQIAQLQNDMVWWVNEEVDGKTVMVPKVYMAKATIEGLEPSRGSLIEGENIYFTVGGDVNNTGRIKAEKDLMIESTGGSIRNKYVMTSGRDMSLKAKEDIENVNAILTAKNNMSLDAGGNILFKDTLDLDKIAKTPKSAEELALEQILNDKENELVSVYKVHQKEVNPIEKEIEMIEETIQAVKVIETAKEQLAQLMPSGMLSILSQGSWRSKDNEEVRNLQKIIQTNEQTIQKNIDALEHQSKLRLSKEQKQIGFVASIKQLVNKAKGMFKKDDGIQHSSEELIAGLEERLVEAEKKIADVDEKYADQEQRLEKQIDKTVVALEEEQDKRQFKNRVARVKVGGNMVMRSGGTISIEGTMLDVKKNVAIAATKGFSMSSVAHTSRKKSLLPSHGSISKVINGKKRNEKEDVRTIHQKARIKAGGFIDISSGEGSIAIQGSNIEAGGIVGLKSRDGIDILSVKEVENKHTYSKRGRTKKWETKERETTIKSKVKGASILAQTQGRITIKGSDLAAEKSIILAGKEGVDILNDTNREYTKTVTKKKKRGLISKRSKKTTVEEKITSVASRLNAGDVIQIQTDGDATLQHAKLNAGLAAVVKAVGDVNLISGQNMRFKQTIKKKSSLGSKSSKDEGSFSIRQQGTEINSGGDVLMQSGGHTAMIASQINAGRDILVNADGGVYVGSAINVNKDWSRKQKSSWFGLSGSTKINEYQEIKQIGSVVTAKKQVAMNSGKNIVIQGSSVKSGGNTYLSAEDHVLITSAKESKESYSFKQSYGVKLGAPKPFLNKKQLNLGVEMNVFELKVSQKTERKETQKASTLESGGGITISAGETVNVEASDLSAEDQLTIFAKDIHVLSKAELSEVSQFRAEINANVGVGVNSLSAITQLPTVKAGMGSAARGNYQSKTKQRSANLTAKNGDVNLVGRERISVFGSHVGSDDGDVNLTGALVDIRARINTSVSSYGYAKGDVETSVNLIPIIPVSVGIPIVFPLIQSSASLGATVGLNLALTAMTGQLDAEVKVGGEIQGQLGYENSTINAKNGRVKIRSLATSLINSNIAAKDIDIKTGALLAESLPNVYLQGDVSTGAELGTSLPEILNNPENPIRIDTDPVDVSGVGMAYVDERSSIIGSNSVDIEAGVLVNASSTIANIKEDGTDVGNLSIRTGTIIGLRSPEGVVSYADSYSIEEFQNGDMGRVLIESLQEKLQGGQNSDEKAVIGNGQISGAILGEIERDIHY